MEAYLHGIEEDLRIFAKRNPEDVVDDKIDELVAALEEMRDEVKEGRPQL